MYYQQAVVPPVMQPPKSPFLIPYAPLQEEGECTLISIEGLRKVTWRFIIFILISIIFAGLPALLAYWFIRLRRWLYYSFCPMDQATHFFIYNYDKKYTIVRKRIGPLALSDREQINAIYFVNRYLKYYFNPQLYAFQALTFNYIPRLTDYFRQQNTITGYNDQTAAALHDTYGYCVMELPRPGCLKLLVLEVLQPFYLFIVYSVILWYYEKYVYYASIILGTTIISLLINLYMVHKLNKKIYKMAYYVTPIHIIRNGQIMELPSPEIVPGDIVMLKKSIKLPFDGILLSGSVLINESALTGESVPIVKKAIEGNQMTNNAGVSEKSSMIYEGTELIQICSYGSEPFHQNLKPYGVMALVTRTSFTTIKGQLIRIISFPRDRKVRFYWQAAKFILFLFLLSIVSYIVLIIKLRKHVQGKDLALKFFDLITITVPPGLPASMSIGIIYCLWRMERRKIYCISPGKIIPGGRVQHICFDKTGTLTDQFMDFHEFVPVANSQFGNAIKLSNRADPQIRQMMSSQHSIEAMNAMATCHSIMNLEGTQKLIGDPMEIKLFEFGQNQLAASSQVLGNYRQSLFSYAGPFSSGTVFRRFQFNSDLQRMSVLASTSTNPQGASVYCKGAPESMLTIMNSNGIPRDYNQVLEKYTACGFRVLAVASRPIQVNQIGTITREAAERGLNFNGFVVFQNKLKPETKTAIYQLKQAQISIVIITGDNALTGANIGFKSGIIEPYYNAMIIDVNNSNQIKVTNFNEQIEQPQPDYIQYGGYIYQNPAASEQRIIQSYQRSKVKTQRDFVCTIEELPRRAIEIGARGRTVFVMTGSAFQRIFTEPITEQKKYLMNYIRVFARTKPNDKTKAITIYQQMGLIVGMCGDGANDCGALKQADAGLSLSEAEASISAPFTSKIPNITSMVELIKQCRSGLATNFSLFNIMALYSLIQYTTTVTVQWFYGYPADLQYLYWDLFCNFFFFLTLGFTPPARRLSVLRPSDSLFSVGNLFSVLLLFGIQMFGQFLVIILMSKSKFAGILNYWENAGETVNLQTYIDNENDFSLETYEVQSLFLFSNFLYLFTVLAFTIDRPWRRHFIFNPFFVIVFLFVFIYSFLIVVVPRARIKGFSLIAFDARWQWLLLGMGLAFGIFMYFLQKCILEPCFNSLRLRYPKKQWL